MKSIQNVKKLLLLNVTKVKKKKKEIFLLDEIT